MINAITVDDEPAVAAIIEHFVEKEKLPIRLIGNAENGLEALKILEEKDVQLVFLDIHMPFMDGFKVIESKPDNNYIIITAYDSFKYAQRALRLGARDILLKPIDPKQLLQAINRVIGWKITDNATLNDILKFINENYYKNITLTMLSNEFFVSGSHISRLFNKYMDTNTISYIHSVRIKNAIELMRDDKLSIKEISEKVGYDNLNNFYKYFKKNTGMTPAMYR